MKACPDRYETLIMDVYGELDSAERSSLEKHLATCQGCREERQEVLHLLERIREEMPVQELSPARAKALSSSVRRRIADRKTSSSWWKELSASPARLVPAMAVACLVVISVGWFTLKMFESPLPEPMSDLNPDKPLIQNDIEVISNLDFLQDLDVVKDLVRVVDDKDVL